jgi:hypothetical protein
MAVDSKLLTVTFLTVNSRSIELYKMQTMLQVQALLSQIFVIFPPKRCKFSAGLIAIPYLYNCTAKQSKAKAW